MPLCGTTYIVYYLGDKMKRSVKILSFIGLGLYGVGVLMNIVNSISELFTTFGFSLFSENTDFSLTTLGLVIASILINLIIAAVIVLFEYRFLKAKEQKSALRLSIVVGVVLLVTAVLAVLNYTPAIPQYLVISKLGLIDTYMMYFMPLLKNGAFLRFIALILMLVAALMFVALKKDKK